MKRAKEITARDYARIVEWSDEDGCFIGSAPPLIGQCCHGSDEVKVYRELLQIIDEWIAIFRQDGRPLPEPREYSGKFVMRIDPALHRLLAVRAERQGESLNGFMTEAARAHLNATENAGLRIDEAPGEATVAPARRRRGKPRAAKTSYSQK